MEFGKPLRIHELNIEGLVEEFKASNIKLSKGFIEPLNPPQKRCVRDPARFKTLVQGRRTGKSMVGIITATAVLLQPGRKVWIVSDNYGLTDRIFSELYHLFVRELGLATPKHGGAASQMSRYIRLPNGSECWGKSIENRNSLVGDALDFLIWDECALTANGMDVWNTELRPLLNDRKGSALFTSTPRGKNHYYELYLMGKRGLEIKKRLEENPNLILTEEEYVLMQYSTIHATSYENTTEYGGYLDKSDIDAARLTMPRKKFEQEYLASFEAVADSVFPEFDKELQVVDYDYIPSLPFIVSMDFNFQTPCTTLYAQIDPNDNILIFDEYFPEAAQKTTHDQAKQLIEYENRLGRQAELVISDIAGDQKNRDGRSSWTDLQDWGINPVGIKQPIEVGCDLIRLYCQYPKVREDGTTELDAQGNSVTYPKLFINKRCKAIIRALDQARAPSDKQGNLKEGYRKDGVVDGPLDALRYLLVYLLSNKESKEARIYKVL